MLSSDAASNMWLVFSGIKSIRKYISEKGSGFISCSRFLTHLFHTQLPTCLYALIINLSDKKIYLYHKETWFKCARIFSFSAGCPNACNRHGTCAFENEEYQCVCAEGWAGVDCNIKLEMSCNDDTDNDKGKLIKQRLFFKFLFHYKFSVVNGSL